MNKVKCLSCQKDDCEYRIRYIKVKIYKDNSVGIFYGLANLNGDYVRLVSRNMDINFKYRKGTDFEIPDDVKWFITHKHVRGEYKCIMDKDGFIMYYKTGLCNTPSVKDIYNQFIKWCNKYIYKGNKTAEDRRRDDSDVVSGWFVHFPKNIVKERIEYERNKRFLELKHSLIDALYSNL